MYHDALTLINNAQKITLISHTTPDGDALGSSLAFYLALKNMGKNVKIFNATKVLPRQFDFLPDFHKITATFPSNCDLIIACDCGNFERLGIPSSEIKLINIDHHKSNTNYGTINIIDATMVSTSMLVHKLLETWEFPINTPIATCLYTALVEDSSFFTTNRVDEAVFKAALSLVNAGANPTKIARELTQRDSLAKLRITALFIDSITLVHSASVAIGYVDEAMFKKSGALRYDTVSLVDMLLSLATVEVAIFMLQLPSGDYKFSLRSKQRDVAAIVAKLGGGGHHHAAGLTVPKKEKETTLQQILLEVKA